MFFRKLLEPSKLIAYTGRCALNGTPIKLLGTSVRTVCRSKRRASYSPRMRRFSKSTMSTTARQRIGSSPLGRLSVGLVLVVWTERVDDLVRIISAWWATKAEQQLYIEYTESMR